MSTQLSNNRINKLRDDLIAHLESGKEATADHYKRLQMLCEQVKPHTEARCEVNRDHPAWTAIEEVVEANGRKLVNVLLSSNDTYKYKLVVTEDNDDKPHHFIIESILKPNEQPGLTLARPRGKRSPDETNGKHSPSTAPSTPSKRSKQTPEEASTSPATPEAPATAAVSACIVALAQYHTAAHKMQQAMEDVKKLAPGVQEGQLDDIIRNGFAENKRLADANKHLVEENKRLIEENKKLIADLEAARKEAHNNHQENLALTRGKAELKKRVEDLTGQLRAKEGEIGALSDRVRRLSAGNTLAGAITLLSQTPVPGSV
jgi:hypothetical protein